MHGILTVFQVLFEMLLVAALCLHLFNVEAFLGLLYPDLCF